MIVQHAVAQMIISDNEEALCQGDNRGLAGHQGESQWATRIWKDVRFANVVLPSIRPLRYYVKMPLASNTGNRRGRGALDCGERELVGVDGRGQGFHLRRNGV